MVNSDETSIMKVKDLFEADLLFTGRTESEVRSVGVGDAPIGSIVAWLKSFTNTPSIPQGWVECDGSVLSDSDSVYNGATLPDLNGDVFLKGQTTSGSTGGTKTIGTTHLPNKFYPSNTNSGTTSYQSGASSHNHTNAWTQGSGNDFEPVHYEVVWIMRVR